MKKLIAALTVLVLLLTPVGALGEMGVLIIPDIQSNSGELTIGETITIDKLCDITLLSYVADTYAMSIPAYERSDDETVKTKEYRGASRTNDSWGDHSRYKYVRNEAEGASSYVDMYYDIFAAEKASSDEYKLLDVRLSVLNRMITPMDLSEVFTAKATFMEDYNFPLTYLRTEMTDPAGNKNEWLTEAKPIPMLVQRNVHFIFEIPNIVAESRESLVVTLGVDGEEYEIVIR